MGAPRVARIDVKCYRVPTDRPEADGTLHWDSTTMVLVEAQAGSGQTGLGFTYASAAAAQVIHEKLGEAVVGTPAADVRGCWERMIRTVRNIGRPGVAAMAISAVDIALWDLWAKLNDQPLFQLLGPSREQVPVYGSGGFTSYTDDELVDQLKGWVDQGIPRVKMKVGTDWGTKPERDVERAVLVREAIGPQAQLFVDANGAYDAKQAVRQAGRFFERAGVSYFEEPVSSDQLEQLAFVRARAPMAIAAGEYGFDPWYFRHMLQADAVDIIQADVTRCLGITGFLEAGTIAHGFAIPFSAHCAPAIHAHAACAVPQIEHIEYFHDHVRIDRLLFEGVLEPAGGCLRPDASRPGLGLELKRADAERYAI
jgi:L-alanine-DL-glutamate epimerase-like enolase superfamily enzyme